MYAHQILADLDHTKSWYDEVNEVLYKQLYDLIITSHQFYMKSTSDLYSLFPPDTLGERIFMDNSDDLFLPYENCLFEFDTHAPYGFYRTAVLTTLFPEPDGMIQENSFTAVFFYKGESSNNYWRVNPVFLHINLGENFPGCQTNLMLHEVWRPSEEGFDMEDYAHKALGPILTCLALSLLLLNCKDTSVGTIRPAPKLQKKRKRKKKYPLFDYHVLKLHVHRIRYKGNDPQNLWKNPLHFCRAQKKYYPPESPLFGKIIGEYKWRSQLRGDPRLGIKMKSYEIIPEEKLWKQ